MRLKLLATASIPQGPIAGGAVVENIGTKGCDVIGIGQASSVQITLPYLPVREELVRVVVSPAFGTRTTPDLGRPGLSSLTRNADGTCSFVASWLETTGLVEYAFNVDVYEVLTDGP